MPKSLTLENNMNIQTSSRLQISWVKRECYDHECYEESVMITEARARFYRLQVMKIYPKCFLYLIQSLPVDCPSIFLVSQYQKCTDSDFRVSFKRISWAYTQDSQESQNCLGWRRLSRSDFFLFRY